MIGAAILCGILAAFIPLRRAWRRTEARWAASGEPFGPVFDAPAVRRILDHDRTEASRDTASEWRAR